MKCKCPLCGKKLPDVEPLEENCNVEELCPQCEAIYLMIEAHILAREVRVKGFKPDDKEPPKK